MYEPVATTKSGGPAGSRFEPAEGGGASFGTHASAQHDGVVTPLAQATIEMLEVAGPLGQDEAMPTATERVDDVADDLLVAVVVGR